MENKYIASLIIKFFENNLPQEIQYKFHRWFVEDEFQHEKRDAMRDVWENHTLGQDAQTCEDLKKIRKRIAAFDNQNKILFYRRISRIAIMLLLPLLGFFSFCFFKHGTTVVEPELIECFIPYGEQKDIVLPDGSTVWVNSGSLLIYAKQFEGKTRTLYLNGEASFHVAKNPDKPFIVKTSDMDIEALGTVFTVESYADGENSIATLESGTVKVETKYANSQQTITLIPNEQLIYNRASKTVIKKTVKPAKNSQKKHGFLVFRSSSFNEIVKTIERQYGVSIYYDADKFAGRAFNVRFLPDEDINQVFEILKDIGGFKYRINGNSIYIIN